MAPHSSILAWRIPWTEEPGRLQSMGSQRDRTERLSPAHSLAAQDLSCGMTGSSVSLQSAGSSAVACGI